MLLPLIISSVNSSVRFGCSRCGQLLWSSSCWKGTAVVTKVYVTPEVHQSSRAATYSSCRSVMFNLRVYWRTSFPDVWSVTAPCLRPSHLLCAENFPSFLYPCSPVWLFSSLVAEQAAWLPEASCCHSLGFKIIPAESSSFLLDFSVSIWLYFLR